MNVEGPQTRRPMGIDRHAPTDGRDPNVIQFKRFEDEAPVAVYYDTNEGMYRGLSDSVSLDRPKLDELSSKVLSL